MYGMSDEQKQIWLDAAGKYGTAVEEETKNTSTVNTTNAMYNIDSGAYYSTEALDRMVATKEVSPEDRKKIEEYQTKAINNRLDYHLTKGDVASATAEAEELYASKLIGKDKYQETYFNATLYNCKNAESDEEVEKLLTDIDALVKEGKLTKVDAKSLKRYVSVKAGLLVEDSQNYSVKINDSATNDAYELVINVGGKKYYGSIGRKVSDSDIKELTDILGGETPKENTIVFLNGYTFIYSGKWRKYNVSDDLRNVLTETATASIPTHTK